ncbi:MAG TPA: bifunctional transaldolase/phosoglucose isomerase [Nitrolancea sp.]|nr:bifunctional transaldolase/phosoglucose isomerase [Nitrolancea sp.]
MANRLQQLASFGQSFWLDNLSREIINSGELERLIQEDGLRGITSNPTIFEKAMSSGDQYDAQIKRLAEQGATKEEIFEDLAFADIRRAADLLRIVYKSTDGEDGYVSIELPPYLASDTVRSVHEAKRFFTTIGRPNVFIKVPGTPAGVPAVEELIAEGINVNITLMFSIQNYLDVVEAYMRGLERRVEQGLPIDSVASVASFFVSRVDTEVDKRIDAMLANAPDDSVRERLLAIKGKTAIANAKIVYEHFTRLFSEPRFLKLKEKGARLQRPLWASTSTKNPEYSDVLYINELIGPNTVNTMTEASINAFRDHGTLKRTVDENVEEAHRIIDELANLGISYDEVTELLQVQGVAAFAKSFESLLEEIEKKRVQFAGSGTGGSSPGGLYGDEVEDAVERLIEHKTASRLWARDTTLWSHDTDVQQKIANRLGWLDSPTVMEKEVARLEALANDVREAGYTKAVLLGMGGSSLAPEVFQRILGNQDGSPELIVLDSTDPATIQRVSDSLEQDKPLFIVSSKSGTTVETTTLYRFFHDQVAKRASEKPGRHFIAITDPGTPLEALAREQGFRYCFLNAPDIGGRYSALSFFGLVPAAIIGLDVRKLLERAQSMIERTQRDSDDNPGLTLGATLSLLAQLGRDKLTFVPDPALAPLADWLEQLIAESTGKDGTGIVPIANEPQFAPGDYSWDRQFVSFDLAPQPYAKTDALLSGLLEVGHPVVRIRLQDEWDIAAEFLRWEFATAVAGSELGINPFDEPNVQESKDNTNRLLATFEKEGSLPKQAPSASEGNLAAFGVKAASVREAVETFLDDIRLGNYLAIMAFCDRNHETEVRLNEIRRILGDRLKVATTLGYGPRFLHSIGQLYKGGPAEGAFLQIVVEPGIDLSIPGETYTFGTLFAAQSLGDFEALEKRRRPVLRLEISGDPVEGLDQVLESLVTAALR